MPTREERLAALLAQPERTVNVQDSVPPGLLENTTPQALGTLAEGIIVTHAAGEALRQARKQRELSMRQAGQVSGRSAPRVKAIEDTGTDIHLGTVVEHAHALGYATHLVLTPLDGCGSDIRADLGQRTDGAPPAWDSETTLPILRKKSTARKQ
ncbi:hypothetical protein [Deinococcus yunweiensis]|uniref:hypothetical protein n=1 Tax=Deinococcus yunweiensis TaxID=367282 RepID=UPI00398F3D3A